jgi:hypothetical protein
MVVKLTGLQMRAARALLRWTADTLAERSRLSIATIKRAEGMDGDPRMTAANAYAVRSALEAAGIEFIDPNGGGPGVRLRQPLPDA